MGFANEIKTGEFEREGSARQVSSAASSKTRSYVIGMGPGCLTQDDNDEEATQRCYLNGDRKYTSNENTRPDVFTPVTSPGRRVLMFVL